MCGYLCTGCGKCGITKLRTRPFGTCFACGHVNKPTDEVCVKCGEPLVRMPGQASRSSGR